VRAVELVVVDDPLVDAGHRSTGDRLDAAFAVQGLGPQLAGGAEAVLFELHPSHAEVAQLVLVGEAGQLDLVAHPRRTQLVVHVEGVLKRGTLARAGPVAHADDDPLGLAGLAGFSDLAQLGVRRVRGGAHGHVVSGVQAKTRGRAVVQFGARRVDDVVVAEFLGPACLLRRRVLDLDGSSAVVGIALGPQGERLGLNETNVLLGIDGGERKDHIVRGHLANAHPNI